jgi:hypothetical protein
MNKKSKKKYEGKVVIANNGGILPKCTSDGGEHAMVTNTKYCEHTSVCSICGITEIVDSGD